MPHMEPDGRTTVQWRAGNVEPVDTGTETTGATPTVTGPTDTASAGVGSHPYPRRDATVADWVRGTAEALGVPLFTPPPPVPVTAGKQGYLVKLTHEQLEDHVEVWPVQPVSPEELAIARTVRLAEAKARIAGTTARLALAHPALHPIIELHSPDEEESCQGCNAGSYAEFPPDWPCRTIELILEGL